MQKIMLAHDGKALDENAAISTYNFKDTDTIFLHKKITIYIDPTNLFKEHSSVKKEFSLMYPNEDYKAVKVYVTDTILQLKQEIRKLYEIPIHRFYLAHGADIHEGNTICGSGIKAGSTVHMHRIETKEANIALDKKIAIKHDRKPNTEHSLITLRFRHPHTTHEFSVRAKKGERIRVVQKQMCEVLKQYEIVDAEKNNDDKYNPDESIFNDYTKLTLRQESGMILLAVKKLSDYNVKNLAYMVIDRD